MWKSALDRSQDRLQTTPLLLCAHGNRAWTGRARAYVDQVGSFFQQTRHTLQGRMHIHATALGKIRVVRDVHDTHYVYVSAFSHFGCKNSKKDFWASLEMTVFV
jgi:hypothetical protein